MNVVFLLTNISSKFKASEQKETYAFHLCSIGNCSGSKIYKVYHVSFGHLSTVNAYIAQSIFDHRSHSLRTTIYVYFISIFFLFVDFVAI